jgi:hypothetical protein
MMEADVMRQLVSSTLTAGGPPGKGSLAANPAATDLVPMGMLPGGALVARFDAFPHPSASFHVGIVGNAVFYLTEEPEAFSAMLRATGTQVTTVETAIGVARTYVETVRSMREFSKVVNGAGDVTLAEPQTPEQDQNVAAAADRLRTLVKSPTAVGIGDAYQVTLFVTRGTTLERRILNITRDATVTEHIEVVATNLPTPITM